MNTGCKLSIVRPGNENNPLAMPGGYLCCNAFSVGLVRPSAPDVMHEQGRLQNGCSVYALFYLDIQHVLDSTGLFLEQLERQAVGQLHPFSGLPSM